MEVDHDPSRLRRSAVSSLLLVPCGVQAFQTDTATAPEHRFTISGNVYLGDTAHPAYNVLVQLQAEDGADRLDAATNESGGFVIYDLKPANYTLALNVQGYERTSVPVDLSFASSKGIQIILQPEESGDIAHKPNSVSSHELSMPKKARDLVASGKTKLYEQHDAAGALDDFKQAVSVAPNYYEAESSGGDGVPFAGKARRSGGQLSKVDRFERRKVWRRIRGAGNAGGGPQGLRAGGERITTSGDARPGFLARTLRIGRALFLEGRIDEAKTSAEQARMLAPAAAIIYRLLANIRLREKDYRAAEADIDEYVKLNAAAWGGARRSCAKWWRKKWIRSRYSRWAALRRFNSISSQPLNARGYAC